VRPEGTNPHEVAIGDFESCLQHPIRTLALWGADFSLMGYNFNLMRKPTTVSLER
jgi:hypothetical protein